MIKKHWALVLVILSASSIYACTNKGENLVVKADKQASIINVDVVDKSEPQPKAPSDNSSDIDKPVGSGSGINQPGHTKTVGSQQKLGDPNISESNDGVSKDIEPIITNDAASELIIKKSSESDLISTLDLAQIKFLQDKLTSMGYKTGSTDGIAGRKTRAAISLYKICNSNSQKINDDSFLIKMIKAKLGVTYADCQVSNNKVTISTTKPKQVSKISQFERLKDVKIGDNIFTIENIDCVPDGSMWLRVYSGKIIKNSKTTALINVQKRYGLRYSPDHTGIDSKNWYCLPKRRYCYSEIDFADWGGKFQNGMEMGIDKSMSFSEAKYSLPVGSVLIGTKVCSK